MMQCGVSSDRTGVAVCPKKHTSPRVLARRWARLVEIPQNSDRARARRCLLELARETKAEQAKDDPGDQQRDQRVEDNPQAKGDHGTPPGLLKTLDLKRKTNTDKGQGKEPDAQVRNIGVRCGRLGRRAEHMVACQ